MLFLVLAVFLVQAPEADLLRSAIAEYRAGRYAESLAHAEAALRMRPDFTGALVFVGANRLALDQPAAAIPPLEKALRLAPNDRNARVMLAEARARDAESRGQFRQAAGRWREAAAINPALKPRLANALFRAADYAAVLEVVVPDSAESWFLRGASLVNLQRPEKGIRDLEKALDLDPKLTPAHAAAGQAYLQMGKAAQAIPHLEAAAATDRDGTVHYQLAQAYRETGDRARAAKAAARYRELAR